MIEQTETLSNSRILKVFLGGLPSNWESDQVVEFMQMFGTVVGVEIKRDTEGYKKGFGFVYLEDHIDPKKLYGKHQYGEHNIEIKELRQKHIYLSFGTPNLKISENLIAQKLMEQDHPVEAIEFGGKAKQRVPNIAKITFVHESSAKYFLHRKFVDIDRVSYNVFSSIDYLKPKNNSPSSRLSKGKAQTQMVGDFSNNQKRYRSHYNYHEAVQDEEGLKEDPKQEYSKPKNSFKKSTDESHIHAIVQENNVQEESYKLPKVSVVQTSTQSSDDQLSTGKTKANEPNRSARKLSYKGKEVEFHPTLVSEETPHMVMVDSSPRNTDLNTEFSSSSRDQYSTMSKLSSTSMDWKLENLVMYPQAGYNPQMLYSLYSQLPASAAFYPNLKKSTDWLAQKDIPFEHHRKKDVRIEFFTFPGFV